MPPLTLKFVQQFKVLLQYLGYKVRKTPPFGLL